MRSNSEERIVAVLAMTMVSGKEKGITAVSEGQEVGPLGPTEKSRLTKRALATEE